MRARVTAGVEGLYEYEYEHECKYEYEYRKCITHKFAFGFTLKGHTDMTHSIIQYEPMSDQALHFMETDLFKFSMHSTHSTFPCDYDFFILYSNSIHVCLLRCTCSDSFLCSRLFGSELKTNVAFFENFCTYCCCFSHLLLTTDTQEDIK